jgi:Domain of unknown function (DUF4186)
MDESLPRSGLKPLKIKCTSSDCSNNLHCFLTTKKLAAEGKTGRCRACGADLVDWKRVSRRDLADVRYTFEALRLEMIRHHFWHTPLTQRAVNHARRKGRLVLRTFAKKQLRQLVGSEKHAREGYQTARETSPQANVIHFAQHATACCCRKCIAEWHGIPAIRPLSDDELDYFTDLVMLYARERIPQMTDEGVSIPQIRNTSGPARRLTVVKRTPESSHAH